jgi:site-specific recombinase XerD
MAKTPKLGGFSKTGRAAQKASTARWSGGRPAAVVARKQEARPQRPAPELRQVDAGDARDFRLAPLVAEWLLDLQVIGRSERTLTWYREKMDGFVEASGVETLGDLTALALKSHMAGMQGRGLADNTVHGSYQVVRGFAAWAARENYPVDDAVLRVRAPKVAQQEPEAYSTAQVQAVLKSAALGWAQMAEMLLLGTGMRVSEMCALTLDDIEDDGETTTLKVRRGKGGKFRRVPVSSRLRRELVRYVNRLRPETATDRLLVLADGRPAEVRSVKDLHKRVAGRVGFRVHAHKFRHTFATEYLRNDGELERLRRILGHTTYVMVMRYVHLDKGDLCRDFDLRSPF